MAMMTYFYERNWSNLKKKKRNKCADSWLFFSINIFFQQKKCNIDPKEFNVFHHLSECVLYIQLDFLMVSRAKHYYSLNLRTSDRRTKNVFIRETIKCNFPHFQDFIAWRKWIIHICGDAYICIWFLFVKLVLRIRLDCV